MIKDLRKMNRRSESVIRGSRRIRRFEADEKEEGAIDTMDMEAIVDMGVKALAPFDIAEMEYEEGEEPAENEAVCEAGDDAEVPVKVDGDKLIIVIAAGIGNNDEDATVEVDLTKPEADVKEELDSDLAEIFGSEEEEEPKEEAKEEEAKECRRNEARRRIEAIRKRRFEAHQLDKRARKLEAELKEIKQKIRNENRTPRRRGLKRI